MPSSRPPRPVRSELTAASAKLRALPVPALAEGLDAVKLADALDAVLAPGGWHVLEQTDPALQEPEEPKRNMAFPVLKSIRDQIMEAVEADPEMKTVTAAVEHGFREFLASRFRPLAPEPGLPAVVEQRVNMNVRPRNSLREQVAASGTAAGRVAAEYLMFRYQLGRYASGAEARLPRGAQRLPEVPRRVRDEIRVQAKATGWRVDDVVNEGLGKFLDGSFEAVAPVWSEEDRRDMVPLSMHPNTDLYERVQGRRAETGLRASQVAIDYLLDQFGIEAGVHADDGV
ncbi:hypothetical protein PV382_23920 [Streptomyces scabiei]|uniref:hypothetical protein n=1 Tax=Streptomyces scabiei TaxID=1930 RepID=UPI000765B38A|nr:hypothetical protein [Streptomyces scabiei]MDX2998144.1 hypothetical protein [Streptomyces scabiei]MDX3050835.1 hypothetical protein [Streptomyces scabiei]MDX3175300.1 hypothetical protein [Streptomyces scabiei]